MTSDGSDGGAKEDIDTLGLGLSGDGGASLVQQTAVPGCAGKLAGGEVGNVVGEADTLGTILHAEAAESETRNGSNIADAEVTLPAVQPSAEGKL